MKAISKKFLVKKGGRSFLMDERDILTKVNHPFLTSCTWAFTNETTAFLVMPFFPGGELFRQIGQEGFFREEQAAFYAAEVTLALEYLHMRGIVHRDLKPENVLLGADGHICVCDFGLAKQHDGSTPRASGAGAERAAAMSASLGEGGGEGDDDEDDVAGQHTTMCGTSYYMAPEMLAGGGYGKTVDWWALGCLLFEMTTGKPPFMSKNPHTLRKQIMKQKLKLPGWLSADTHSVLKGLLDRNLSRRLGCGKSTMFKVRGVAAIKQHAFFRVLGDWGDLGKTRVDPPIIPTLDSETDTRNFDAEFTTMSVRLSGEAPASTKPIAMSPQAPKRSGADTVSKGSMSKKRPSATEQLALSFGGFSFVAPEMLSASQPTTPKTPLEVEPEAASEPEAVRQHMHGSVHLS